jgi:hypothetical protein
MPSTDLEASAPSSADRGAGSTTGAPRLFQPDGTRTTPWGLVVALLAVAAGTVVCVVRQPNALNTIWAEDGKIFYTQVLSKGVARSLLTPYNGYAHVVPRLLALLASAFPLGDAAKALTISASVVTAGVAVLVYRVTGNYLRSTWVRLALAAFVLLLPGAQNEVLGNIANLHWYLLFASFWILLWNPRHGWEVAIGAAVVFLGAASDPLALLFLPLVVLRWQRLPSTSGRLPCIALGLGIAAQVAARIAQSSSRDFAQYANPLKLGPWYAFDTVGRSLFGTRVLGGESASGWLLALFACLALLALVYLAYRRRDVVAFPIVVFAIVGSAAFFAVPSFLTGVAAPRYEAIPVLLVASAVALTLDPAGRSSGGGTERLAAVVRWTLAIWIIVLCIVEFRVDSARAHGPDWRPSLAASRASCLTGRHAVKIPVTPRGHGWAVTVPCQKIVSSAEIIPAQTSGAMPTAANTGPRIRRSDLRTVQGNVLASSLGARHKEIAGVRITGMLTIDVPGARVRDSWIEHGVRIAPRARGRRSVLDHVELGGCGQGSCGGVAIGDDSYALRAANIHEFADGPRANGDVDIEGSFIHDLVELPESHNDGIQTTGIGGLGTVTIRGNTIWNPIAETSAVGLGPSTGQLDRQITVDHNWLAGGGYTLYGGSNGGKNAGTYQPTPPPIFVGNVFQRIFFPNGGFYGPVTYLPRQVVWEGNVWPDGSAVPRRG